MQVISAVIFVCYYLNGYDVIVVDSFVNSSKKLENVKEILDLENKTSSNKIKILRRIKRFFIIR